MEHNRVVRDLYAFRSACFVFIFLFLRGGLHATQTRAARNAHVSQGPPGARFMGGPARRADTAVSGARIRCMVVSVSTQRALADYLAGTGTSSAEDEEFFLAARVSKFRSYARKGVSAERSITANLLVQTRLSSKRTS